MEISKKYLHDRIVLLLLTINGFLILLATILIFLKISSGQGGNYIIQYRPNLGISAYGAGKQSDFLAFILFGLVTFGLSVVLSVRIFSKHRSFALAILGFTTLISVLTVIVSNALLVLS